jgi:hypothetical protein
MIAVDFKPVCRIKTCDRRAKLQAILARDGNVCYFCKFPVAPADYSIEHVIPLIAGGTNNLTNLALAHMKCNSEASKLHNDDERAFLLDPLAWVNVKNPTRKLLLTEFCKNTPDLAIQRCTKLMFKYSNKLSYVEAKEHRKLLHLIERINNILNDLLIDGTII